MAAFDKGMYQSVAAGKEVNRMENQKEHDFIVMTDEELMLLTGGDNFLAVEPEPAIDPDRNRVVPLYGIRPPRDKWRTLYGIEPRIEL
jgi:hypothetical protein